MSVSPATVLKCLCLAGIKGEQGVMGFPGLIGDKGGRGLVGFKGKTGPPGRLRSFQLYLMCIAPNTTTSS